jgi:hypothetical protein
VCILTKGQVHMFGWSPSVCSVRKEWSMGFVLKASKVGLHIRAWVLLFLKLCFMKIITRVCSELLTY